MVTLSEELEPGWSEPARTASAPARVYPGLWWLSPPGAILLVIPLTLGLAEAYSSADFQTYFRTAKSLTSGTTLLFAAGAVVFVLGALITQVGRRPAREGTWPWLGSADLDVLARVGTVLFRLTVVGYVSFVLAAAANGVTPGELWTAVIGQDVSSGDLETTIGTIPGVTTLTQVGVAYSIVATLLLLHRRDRKTVVRLVVLVLMTVVRSFVFTERLALIEVVVPALTVALVRASATGTSTRRRVLMRVAPIPLIGLLIVGFAASEYSRSYNFYKTRTDDSLLVFASKRLSGYYATAYNNGQLLLTYDQYPERLPYTSIEGVWTAPGIEQLGLYDKLVGRDSQALYEGILDTYGNPEFNNPGGLAAPFVDFGRAGGIVVLLGLGLLTGAAYRGFVEGRITAVLLYPVVVTGLFEIPRFLYWTLGRVVPTVLALLFVAHALTRSARARARSASL